MNAPDDEATVREQRARRVAVELLPQIALLTRLFVRRLGACLSRSEAALLSTLSGGPRRITELAELEGVAQPTMTLLVKRLERTGLLTRARDDADGRVVRVEITPAGAAALDAFRAQASASIRTCLDELSDAEIAALANALDPLAALVCRLQDRGPGG